MTALAKDTRVQNKDIGRSISVPLAAGAIVHNGSIVAVNALGMGLPLSDAAGLAVIGISDLAADNTGGANGDIRVRVRKGVFELRSGGTDVDQADVGRAVYGLDDATVSKIGGVAADIIAGILDSIDVASGLPWVKIADEAGSAGASASALPNYSNATRPAAADFAAGTGIWNTDDDAPNWSDGSAWRDSAGGLT